MDKKETLIVIAGEESGDVYGGMLVKDILNLRPDLDIIGMGGDRMRNAGVDLLCHVSQTAVMGAIEMLDSLLFLYKIYRQFLAIMDDENIVGVVLIDYPDFNLRVASSAHKRDIPVFYYISPQVWAWRKGRVRLIKKTVKNMIPILPFEKKFYEDEGVHTDFVGHPLIDIVKSTSSREELRREFNIEGDGPVIGILPGSRKKEIRYLLPEILKSVRLLKEKFPSALFLLPLSSSIDKEQVCDLFSEEDKHIIIVPGRNYDVMTASDVLITKSGTSTLEAAIAGVPMVVIYKASFLSILLASILVNVKFAGLPNLLADREIVPELLQHRMKAEYIVREVVSILKNEKIKIEMKRDLASVKKSLGPPGASMRVAELVVKGLNPNPK